MRRLPGYVLFISLLLLLFFGQAISLYTDWLWFQELGFTQVFTTILTFKLSWLCSWAGFFLCSSILMSSWLRTRLGAFGF